MNKTNDSINNVFNDSMTNLNLAEHGQDIQMIIQYSVIIIPVMSLLIAYFLKYFLGKEATKETFVYFLLEFPVDLFFLGISVITTLFFASKEIVTFGLVALLVSLGVVAISCLLRQKAIKLYEREKMATKSLWGITVGNFTISVFYIWSILQFIKL